MKFKHIYYEIGALEYELGKKLMEQYKDAEWIEIENHNNIEVLRKKPNTEFAALKRYLIIATRKTHVYRINQKVSDFLVPYTSSGCTAMCLYCYLVCNYNKCAYLRLFVNREQMLQKLLKTARQGDRDLTFEIGSNSDLILENTITQNLEWTIEEFAKQEKGFITFPTKFSMVDSILALNHRGRVITRVSVNPEKIIKEVEIGTSSLNNRIKAVNELCAAGYKTGILIAPIVMMEGWQELYLELFDQLNDKLSLKMKESMFIEVIFMTYSYIHRAINKDAFPETVELYNKALMTGRGRGKYTYNNAVRAEAEMFLRQEIGERFGEDKILYIV